MENQDEKIRLNIPRYMPGHEVVFTRTNPGYQGVVMGMMPTQIYLNGVRNGQEVTESWQRHLGLPYEKLICYFTYLIYFDDAKLPGPRGNGFKEENEDKTQWMWTHEQDIIHSREYWENMRKAIENVKLDG